MAYITTEQVQEKRKMLKEAFPAKDGWKLSVTKEHYTSINIAIMQYPEGYDFGTKYEQINHYCIDDYTNFGDKEKAVLKKISDIAHIGHWDESDIMTDYFDCAFYINIQIGKWDKQPVQAALKGKKQTTVKKLTDFYMNLVKEGQEVGDVLKLMYS